MGEYLYVLELFANYRLRTASNEVDVSLSSGMRKQFTDIASSMVNDDPASSIRKLQLLLWDCDDICWSFDMYRIPDSCMLQSATRILDTALPIPGSSPPQDQP